MSSDISRCSQREFGDVPVADGSLTVTYLSDDLAVHVPFAMTSDRVWRPTRVAAGFTTLLLGVMLALAFGVRAWLRQTLPARTLARLDDGSGAAAEFVELVRGELVLEPEPVPDRVVVNGRIEQRRVVGRVEHDRGWRGYVQMVFCLAAYYGLAVALWTLVPLSGHAEGHSLDGWAVAVGLSILTVPILLLALAMKPGLPVVAAVAVVAVGLQFLLVWRQAAQDPGSAALVEAMRQNPVRAFAAWALPPGAMIALERWRWLRRRLRMETKLYE